MNRRATVRGTARRVVIVPPPEDGPFEQAIFVVKAGSGALSESELLREALAAAAGTEEAAPAAPGDGLALAPETGPALDTHRRSQRRRGRDGYPPLVMKGRMMNRMLT